MKKLIIGNWKMNPSSARQARKLFNKIKKTKAIICPPFIYLSIFNYKSLGAQDCHYEQLGAFTGEVSPRMLKDLGCDYVIIGHSERRKYFNETDEVINKKLKAALKAGLKPILCIGEKKGENPEIIIENQLAKDLEGISEKDLKKIIIAYEPVWAISTSGGEICSPEQAKKMLNFIKQRFEGKIIYGGSVDSKIINSYLRVGYVGALVGNASLDAEEFIKIVKNV